MYQLGALGILFVALTATLSVVIIALFKGKLEVIAGLLVALLLVYWFSDIRSPTGFGGRLHRLLRDGVHCASEKRR